MDSVTSLQDQLRQAVSPENISQVTSEILATTRVVDMHTHLFPPRFRNLSLWGIDNLLTYHYLEAELFRNSDIRPDEYWMLDTPSRADLVWRTLFVENAPLSEATRGVVAVLQALGLDATAGALPQAREYFRAQNLETYLPRIFELAGVRSVVMTNDPLDTEEWPHWAGSPQPDSRFRPALRLDRLLNQWTEHYKLLGAQGFAVDRDLSRAAIGDVRRFLENWCEFMKPLYMAVSLPDSFTYPDQDNRTHLLANVVLPMCRDMQLPLALMIGVRRQVNPDLGLAGDALGRANLQSLENLCRSYPDNRFLVSVLSRENQHELCVYARKFANLMPFGCWWFLNNPSIVEEITRERLEMLGASFIAQNSDARVLEQLIYKWRNTRRTIGPLIARQFQTLAEDGRVVTRAEIQDAITSLFRTNFEHWTAPGNSR